MHTAAVIGFVAAAMLAAPANSLAAGPSGFYINDPAQAKQADAVDASTQSTDTLKPFDVQIANLNSFAKQEDLAVAGLYAAMRDKAVTDILNDQLAQAKVKSQPYNDARIRKYVCQELNALLAPPPEITVNSEGLLDKTKYDGAGERAGVCPTISDADLNALETLPGKLRVYVDIATGNSRIVGEARTAFELEEASKPNAGAMIDDSCAGLMKLYRSNIPSTIIGDTKLVILISQCRDITDTVDPASPQGLMSSIAQNWPNGELYKTYDQWQKAAKATSGVIDSPSFIAELQQQKTAAEMLAKSGDVGTLKTFESQLSALIAGEQSANAELSGLVKLKALQNVQAVLDCVGSGLTGNTKAAAAPAPAAAPSPPTCATAQAGVASDSSSGAALAVAQLADVHDPRYRSANWIAGAGAIVSAYKADAQIQAGAETLKAAAAEARFRALAREASSLLEAQDDLDSGTAKRGVASGDCEVSPLACALTHYAASWNSGRIPAEVLGNRALQVERVTQAQRWKNAMAGQRAVILAATASLKSYADGGLQPGVIAQVAFDLGLIAATAAK